MTRVERELNEKRFQAEMLMERAYLHLANRMDVSLEAATRAGILSAMALLSEACWKLETERRV